MRPVLFAMIIIRQDMDIDHTGNLRVKGVASCLSCHDSAGTLDIVEDIHLNNCGSCHAGGVGGATLINAAAGNEGGADCLACHSTYGSYYNQGHPTMTMYNHSDQLVANSGCNTTGCHDQHHRCWFNFW
jgi:hypothetical protein